MGGTDNMRDLARILIGDFDPQYYYSSKASHGSFFGFFLKNIIVNKERFNSFFNFVLADWAVAQFNPYYRHQYRNHPISAGIRLAAAASGYLSGSRNYNSARETVNSNMPPTRNTKRVGYALRSQSAYPTPGTPTPRGRQMSISSSRSAARSMSVVPRVIRTSASGGAPQFGGKLTTKRIKRTKSKFVKNRRKAAVGGIVHVQETSGIQTDPNCVYLGHALPIWQIRYAAWWAVIRQLYLLAGGTVGELKPDTIVTSAVNGFTVGDTITLTYRLTSTAATSTVVYTTVAGDTLDTLISTFAQNLPTDVSTVEFLNLVYQPVAASANKRSQLRLDLLIVNIAWKSSMKLQNRTISATGNNESDDIDNVPVYGKSYSGPGLGCKLVGNVSQTLVGFVANQTTGLIKTAASSNAALQEPPEPKQFHPVKQSGKVKLGSGEVKTSVLTKKINVRFGYLMNILAPAPAAASSSATGLKINGRFSIYRMFAVEKMMDVNAGVLTDVTVAFENDSKVFVSVKQKYSNPTVEYKVPTYRL